MVDESLNWKCLWQSAGVMVVSDVYHLFKWVYHLFSTAALVNQSVVKVWILAPLYKSTVSFVEIFFFLVLLK